MKILNICDVKVAAHIDHGLYIKMDSDLKWSQSAPGDRLQYIS